MKVIVICYIIAFICAICYVAFILYLIHISRFNKYWDSKYDSLIKFIGYTLTIGTFIPHFIILYTYIKKE